jgi:sodium/potassium-transporting ATPase subunit alpha
MSGIVIQTGGNTVFGRIAKLSSVGAPARTTLQTEIYRFVMIIISLALFFGVLVTVLWGAWLNREYYGFITSSGAVINLVAVCVAFIPEGMPSAVTISLSVVANRLSKNKILCKTLMTVETLGAVDVLCSDKTGTLTKNVMTVTNAAVLDDEVSAMEARDRIVRGGEAGEGCTQLAAVAGICNSATFAESSIDQPIGLRLVNGDATGTSCFVSSMRHCSELTPQTLPYFASPSRCDRFRNRRLNGSRNTKSTLARKRNLCSRYACFTSASGALTR